MEMFDEEELEKALQSLEAWKRIVFMAQIGMRMLPNYECFSGETGFGHVSVLRRAFDVAWDWVESGRVPPDLAALQSACEQQVPNTEQFHSPYTSAALDAANTAVATLEALKQPDVVHAIEVASLARDTADLFVQELLNLDPDDPTFEETIRSHDLMQRELRCQREDLDALADWTGNRAIGGREFRARKSVAGEGWLDRRNLSRGLRHEGD